MRVKCQSCSEVVLVDVLKVEQGEVARCPNCGQLAWTDIKDDVIITFARNFFGVTAKVYSDF